MHEVVLTKVKYIQFPEEVATRVPDHLECEKLALHQCYNGNLNFQESQWPNLRYLEIIGCTYLEIRLNFPSQSMLEQMYLSQCENVDIWEISGQLPNFIACRIDASKYVKFKGEISGNIGLQSLEFDHALRSEIFQQPTYLPYLTRLVIQNGSNFFKLNLEKLKAPQLKVLELRDSNYVNIESMGEIAPQLTKFSFENCSYPKLNIDFKKLSQLSHQTALDSDEGDCVSVFNPNVFRKVKSVRKKKKLSRIAREIYTDPNSPDLELYKSTLSVSDATTQANAFLDRSNSTNSTNILLAKFCPECGTKNPQTATFCSQCGSKFPKIG